VGTAKCAPLGERGALRTGDDGPAGPIGWPIAEYAHPAPDLYPRERLEHVATGQLHRLGPGWREDVIGDGDGPAGGQGQPELAKMKHVRSEEHTSELQSRENL